MPAFEQIRRDLDDAPPTALVQWEAACLKDMASLLESLERARAEWQSLSAQLAEANEAAREAQRPREGRYSGQQLGRFVVGEVLGRHKEVLKARLVVAGETGNDSMTLKCEVKERPAGLADAIVASIRDVTKLRGEVELVDAGSLPNDGKVIDDTRKYN